MAEKDRMTYDEFMEKYGDVKVKFVSYYKYSFSFANDDGSIQVGLGGSGDDIYRLEVNTKPISIAELMPSWATIDGKFYDWQW